MILNTTTEEEMGKFNDNGCPYNCPCLDDYPNCYCEEILKGDKNNDN